MSLEEKDKAAFDVSFVLWKGTRQMMMERHLAMR